MPNQAAPASEGLHSLIERGAKGVNFSSGVTALEDGEYLQLENVMPYDNGNNVIPPFPNKLSSTVANPARMWAMAFNNDTILIAQDTGGQVWASTNFGAFLSIAATGATTVNGLHFVVWKGADAQGNPSAILWVDTVKGYGSWDGTTWKVLQSTVIGQAIEIYAGRVWIASDQEVLYTAPDAYNDFEAADFAGSFVITDPSLSGPVIALKATENWLYLIGSGMLALNNVQVQSVAGSSTLVTTYYLTAVSSEVAVQNDAAAIVSDNVLMVVTNSGVWGYYGLNGKRLSGKVGDAFTGAQQLAICHIFGRLCLLVSNGYVMIVDSGTWFTIITQSSGTSPLSTGAWVSLCSVSLGSANAFAITSANTYQLFSNFSDGAPPPSGGAPSSTIQTKLYDAGNPTIDKRLLKVGFELSDSLLEEGGGSMAKFGCGVVIQAFGYTAQSQRVGSGTTAPVTALPNTWRSESLSLEDRYFGLSLGLYAPPGMAITLIAFGFRIATNWPMTTDPAVYTYAGCSEGIPPKIQNVPPVYTDLFIRP